MGTHWMPWQGSDQSSHLLHVFLGSMGMLQQQLCKGEFVLFKHFPMFENNFIQMSKREVIDVQMVTGHRLHQPRLRNT